MRKLILTLLLCCSLSGLAADYEAGKAAYNRGDYAEAARRYRIAAEQGDVEAQNQLGYMYRLGQGVPKDDVEAASWTRKAAEQGNADAQARLGYMYGIGRGVLRAAVERHLKGHPQVAGQRLGAVGEGGRGVTIVRLR